MKRILWALPLVLVAGCVLLFALRLKQQPSDELPSPWLGRALPELHRATGQAPMWLVPPVSSMQKGDKGADKRAFAAAQHAAGHQPFILSVWATWCPSCVREHRVLVDIAAQGTVFLGLNYKDDATKARAFLAEYGNPFLAVLADPKGDYGFDLGVYGAPEHFLVSSDGVLLDKHVGEFTFEVWQRWKGRFFSHGRSSDEQK